MDGETRARKEYKITLISTYSTKVVAVDAYGAEDAVIKARKSANMESEKFFLSDIELIK